MLGTKLAPGSHVSIAEDVSKNLALKRGIVGGRGGVEEAADGVGRLPLLLPLHLLYQPIRCVLAVEARQVVVVVHEPTRLTALRFVPTPVKKM